MFGVIVILYGVFCIGFGLTSLFDLDMAWYDHERWMKRQGKVPERTSEWENTTIRYARGLAFMGLVLVLAGAGDLLIA